MNNLQRGTAGFVCVLVTLTLVHRCAQGVTIDTVPVGNPGNPPDTRFDRVGFGSVAYNFRIGKTEVTNAQYVEFLNAVAASDTFDLYNTYMDTDTWGGIVRSGPSGDFRYDVKAPALGGNYIYDDKPVVYVSWYDSLRFANWLHNGQPSGMQNSGTTEDGAYTFSGVATVGLRNSGARWWLPSEDEWYKAAYHKNDGVTANYWTYPTTTNVVPNNNLPSSDTGNSANFLYNNNYTTGNVLYPMTNVGAYTLSGSPYGTFDQGGSVWERNEAIFFYHGMRGGTFAVDSSYLRASSRNFTYEGNEYFDLGFRVAGIPEPTTLLLGTMAGISLFRLGRTRFPATHRRRDLPSNRGTNS